ncbi:MAG: hypothetical protein NVS3B14_18620 [Ktedonobacteraceae bacterium]
MLPFWLTSDLKVEDPHNQENGEQPYHDRTHDAVGRASASEQLTDNTDHGCNQDPNEHLCERD